LSVAVIRGPVTIFSKVADVAVGPSTVENVLTFATGKIVSHGF